MHDTAYFAVTYRKS